MKLLIVGSRGIKDIDISMYLPENVECIISGGAVGADTIAERYADKQGIHKIIIKPKYELYGRAAPIKRNKEMVDMCDQLLAFWDGRSRGTKYTISYAKKMGKIVRVIIMKE